MAENDIVVGTLKQGENDFYPRTSKELVAGMPSALSDLTADSTHRVVTDAEKATWNGKYTKPANGIPGSDLASGVIPSVPVQDVTVGGSSVVNASGVAEVPAIPEIVQAQEIEIDSAPTANSNNLVTSGGVYAVLGDIETLINAL